MLPSKETITEFRACVPGIDAGTAYLFLEVPTAKPAPTRGYPVYVLTICACQERELLG